MKLLPARFSRVQREYYTRGHVFPGPTSTGRVSRRDDGKSLPVESAEKNGWLKSLSRKWKRHRVGPRPKNVAERFFFGPLTRRISAKITQRSPPPPRPSRYSVIVPVAVRRTFVRLWSFFISRRENCRIPSRAIPVSPSLFCLPTMSRSHLPSRDSLCPGRSERAGCQARRRARIAWVKPVRSWNRFPATTGEPVPVFRCAKRQCCDLNGYGQTRYSTCSPSSSRIKLDPRVFPCLGCPLSFAFFSLLLSRLFSRSLYGQQKPPHSGLPFFVCSLLNVRERPFVR